MIKQITYMLLFSSMFALAQKKPNMVLFLADDLTYRDIACYGSENGITPVIDDFAKQGIKFNSCYQASPMCSPTRQNLYSGQYPVKTGAYPNHSFTNGNIKTLPYYLKELGYRVALLGKGHIGPREVYPFEWLGDKAVDPKTGKNLDYMDLDKSASFLNEVSQSEEPFCLVICSHQPHGPFTLGDRSLFNAEKLKLRGNVADTPQTREKFVEYYAEINFLDGQLDTVLSQLKENNLDDNTLTVFLSEQGNSFALSKWTCYEDGVKSAFIARWPGMIKPGTKTDAIVEYNDIVPTFIDAAGGDLSEPVYKDLDGVSLLPIFKNPSKKIKNYAFSIQTTRGIIKGSEYNGVRAVTDGKYRYIYNISPEVQFSNGDVAVSRSNPNHWLGSWLAKKDDPQVQELYDKFLNRPQEELYNNEKDPDNLINLANDKKLAGIKKELKTALFKWMEECGDKGLETELLAFQRIGFARSPKTPVIGQFHNACKVTKGDKIKYTPSKDFEAYFEAPMDGYYTIYKNRKAKIATTVTVDDEMVVDENYKATYGLVALKKGLHKIKVVSDPKEKTGDIKFSGPNILSKPLNKTLFFKEAL